MGRIRYLLYTIIAIAALTVTYYVSISVNMSPRVREFYSVVVPASVVILFALVEYLDFILRNTPDSGKGASTARKKKRDSFLVTLAIKVALIAAYTVALVTRRNPYEIITMSGAAILIIALLAVNAWVTGFVVNKLLPGRKLHAQLTGKKTKVTSCTDADNYTYRIETRVLIFKHNGMHMELITDEWDYNHLSIGEEGTLEYKKNELISFERTKKRGSQLPQ